MRRLCGLYALLMLLACGTPGPAGPPGPPGPPGAPGSPGPGLYIQTSAYCSVVQSGGLFTHNVYTFSDGSVMTTCEVADGEYSIESTRLYKSTQNGAATAACSVTNDWDGTLTAGYWSFAKGPNASASVATYNDSGSPMHGQTRTMPCNTTN